MYDRFNVALMAALLVGCGVAGPKKTGRASDDGATDSPWDFGSGGATASSASASSVVSVAAATSGVGGGGGAGGIDDPGGTGGHGQQPPMQPVYRVPLRVHVGESQLPESELVGALEEVNWIWWSQAAVCFEIEIVEHGQLASTGFDINFVPSLSGSLNGYYAGDHDVWTIDYPNLGASPNPVDYPAARTTAHELGHGLTLDHYNGFSDSNNSLMSSGKLGWDLHDFEVEDARGRAAQMALEDTSPNYCAAVTP